VEPGTLSVRIELDGHEPYVDDHVVVGAGQTLRLRATLQEAMASLVVITDPPGIEATLDGVPLGATPVHAAKLAPRHGGHLLLVKTGFITATVPIDLAPGKTTK